MGLLDNREPPTYSDKLKKYDTLYRLASKVMTLRGSTDVTGIPQKGFRFYAYHLLGQQGLPGAVKVAIFASWFIVPPMIIELLSARRHPYKKDPFR